MLTVCVLCQTMSKYYMAKIAGKTHTQPQQEERQNIYMASLGNTHNKHQHTHRDAQMKRKK